MCLQIDFTVNVNYMQRHLPIFSLIFNFEISVNIHKALLI